MSENDYRNSSPFDSRTSVRRDVQVDTEANIFSVEQINYRNTKLLAAEVLHFRSN